MKRKTHRRHETPWHESWYRPTQFNGAQRRVCMDLDTLSKMADEDEILAGVFNIIISQCNGKLNGRGHTELFVKNDKYAGTVFDILLATKHGDWQQPKNIDATITRL